MAVVNNSILIAEGVHLWRDLLDRPAQSALLAEVLCLCEEAPFYRPTMPRSGKPFSVEETNFGRLGWFSDKSGYRYVERHPTTGRSFPEIPLSLLTLWNELTAYGAPPECCLVNLYREGARMGPHQDRDETALDAPVLSVSLGDDALFRIGGTSRSDPSRSVTLSSGDVIMFGGMARLAYHGIDRISGNTSRLLPGGGRINLTLRRVNATSREQFIRSQGPSGA